MTPKGKLDEFAAHVRGVKAQARAGGRELDVYTVAVVTCRPTTREAEEYYRHSVIDNADWAAVDRIMAMRGVTREKFPDDFEERRLHQANGMGGMPVVGDPDVVARELASLAAAGAKGIALSFVNYLDELPFFATGGAAAAGSDGAAREHGRLADAGLVGWRALVRRLAISQPGISVARPPPESGRNRAGWPGVAFP